MAFFAEEREGVREGLEPRCDGGLGVSVGVDLVGLNTYIHHLSWLLRLWLVQCHYWVEGLIYCVVVGDDSLRWSVVLLHEITGNLPLRVQACAGRVYL